MKLKAMISQPMAGKTPEQITQDRETAIKTLEDLGYEVINTYFSDEWYSSKSMEERGVVNKPLCFFAKSIENMANVHLVLFVDGWQEARGCKLEHSVAKAYGISTLYQTHIVQEEARNDS